MQYPLFFKNLTAAQYKIKIFLEIIPAAEFICIHSNNAAQAFRGCNSVVECQLPKLDVVGSSPITRSLFLLAFPGTACFILNSTS